MNHNTTNDQLSSSSSSDNQDMLISGRRSSSRINSKEASSLRRRSSVQGGISKKDASHSSRKSSKGTPQLRRKQKENNVDLQMEMECSNANDIHNSSSSENHEDEEQNPLNISSASADTIIVEDFDNNKNLQKQPIEYFTPVNGTDREYKYNPFSDTNLRSHLGFKHGFYCYLYPSQIKQRENIEKKPSILPHVKKKLDTAAIKCIVKDGLSFGTFRHPGMQHFLDIIKPGYRGPSRQTVRKHLDKMYQERRSSLKEKFKIVPFISLTTDLWMNSRRYHFLVITAHYHNEHYETFSDVISIRSFRGRHLSARLKKFILHEIKKLEIETKIFSIATDNGGDIKSATSSQEFGIRFSCDAHNINRAISTGLDLWKKITSKSWYALSFLFHHRLTSFEWFILLNAFVFILYLVKKAPNEHTHDSDDHTEKSRLVDIDVIFDEWVNHDENYLNNENDGDADYITTLGDQDETDSCSDTSDDDNNTTLTQSQKDSRIQDEEEQEEIQQLLLNPDKF
ncbi:unnamed protein product [Rotaria sp. Silwood2]|nr:unnamed protein product [Rotaria sp. Silwood2]